MLRGTVSWTLLFSVMFAISPAVLSAEKPFVLDDFESGLGNWFGSGGGGAANGIFEETDEAHDGETAMKIMLPKGNAGFTAVQSRDRGAEFVKLEGRGYEAISFWTRGIKSIDAEPVLLMLTGIGAHTTNNRWTYNFTAPLDEWTLLSIPFKDFKKWQLEKREFDINLLGYPTFYTDGGGLWPDIEFIVDQIEVGPITQEKPRFVEPSGKLSATWGRIRGY